MEIQTCSIKGKIECTADLSAETKFRAPTFSTPTTAWHISTTAHIPITKKTIRILLILLRSEFSGKTQLSHNSYLDMSL